MGKLKRAEREIESWERGENENETRGSIKKEEKEEKKKQIQTHKQGPRRKRKTHRPRKKTKKLLDL